jgi:hypothetical protein
MGFALTAPVVARWSKDYSTVLSRDAVAKTLPSTAQAPSQIIRACDLSTAIGTYPTYGGYKSEAPPRGFSGMKRNKVRTGLFPAEQAPGSITRDG